MKDKQGLIIYIGKAKNLKNRVTSYFRGFNSHMPKTQTLVVNIDEFEYILTDTEVEALILESNLIKQHKPRFNIRLKDDKAYPYIKITDEDFPRVIKVREIKKDKAKYFGPYTSNYDVNTTIEVIQKVFPIRQCNKDLTKKHLRPCLNYHIKQCLGPCKGDVHKEAYNASIQQIALFLSGREDELIKNLEAQMMAHADQLAFEKAAEIRNQLQSLKHLTVKQKVNHASGIDQDVISIHKIDDQSCVMVFFVRGGLLLGREHFIFDDTKDETTAHILNQFILQFYGGTAYLPREILLSEPVEDQESFEEWLSQKAGKRVYFLVPKIGDKKKLIEMVHQNAVEYLDKFYQQSKQKQMEQVQLLENLKDMLSLPSLPKRIEAFDISNTMGVFSVGSMVVYEMAEKKKSDYRRFKVKTIEGPNDYGSMMEILYRRFKRGKDEKAGLVSGVHRFDRLPDLLLIDGGKGHVHAVEAVIKALQIDVPVVGMVKDQKHRSHALYYQGQTIQMDRHGGLYRFISSIQDEVHRFAITYHRSLRDKTMTQSILDDIDGIGPKRKKALLQAFKTVDRIKEADMAALTDVEGITETIAKKVYGHFRKGKSHE